MTFAEDEPVPVRIVEPALIDIEIMIVEYGQYVEAREVTSRMFCLGIVGEYLAKTYLEVKHRPIYITRETEQDRDERKPAQQK